MHLLILLAIDTLVSGAAGYLYGAKVQKAAEAEAAKLATQAQAAVVNEAKKL